LSFYTYTSFATEYKEIMVDVRNAQRSGESFVKNHKQKYKLGTSSYDSKKLGYFTSKYFECNDEVCAKNSSEKQKRYLNIAAKIASKSPMYTHKHGAIIVYKDKIISSGYNYYMGDFSIHAEVAAISKINKKQKHLLCDCDIYVVRIGPKSLDTPLKYSKPCSNCQNTIIKNNIKNAYYSTSYDYDDIRSIIHKKNECNCYLTCE
jgi:deoxycytidylate deaminase